MYQSRCFVLLIVFYMCVCCCNAHRKNTFEAIIEDARNCPNPNPPYPKKPTIISEFSITVMNGKRYLNGKSTVIEHTPFLNFSGRTYAVDKTGNRVIKFQMTHVSCRNMFVRSILMYGNITLQPKTCMLNKGIYQYQHIDLDKVSHAFPSWHAPGDIIHELQLVRQGMTVFCEEIKAKIRLAPLK